MYFVNGPFFLFSNVTSLILLIYFNVKKFVQKLHMAQLLLTVMQCQKYNPFLLNDSYGFENGFFSHGIRPYSLIMDLILVKSFNDM